MITVEGIIEKLKWKEPKKTFLNLSSTECLSVYSHLIENADRHIDVAKKIAEAKEYGIATSHLVLGAEELVKGILIYLKGNNISLNPISGYEKFYKNHVIRHEFAQFTNLLFLMIEPLFEIIKSLSTNNFDPMQMNKRFEEILNKADSQNFWDKAEMLKEKGFYVDYRDELITPSIIKQSEFESYKVIVLFFIEKVKQLIETLNQMPQQNKQEALVLSKELITVIIKSAIESNQHRH